MELRRESKHEQIEFAWVGAPCKIDVYGGRVSKHQDTFNLVVAGDTVSIGKDATVPKESKVYLEITPLLEENNMEEIEAPDIKEVIKAIREVPYEWSGHDIAEEQMRGVSEIESIVEGTWTPEKAAWRRE